MEDTKGCEDEFRCSVFLPEEVALLLVCAVGAAVLQSAFGGCSHTHTLGKHTALPSSDLCSKTLEKQKPGTITASLSHPFYFPSPTA